MASGYATFASGGIYCPPTSIDSVSKPDGTKLELPERQCTQALSTGVAAGVNAALKRVISGGTGTGASLKDGRPVAGKTGTTDRSKAAWFCGYTPQLATAIWTGYPGQQRVLRGTIGGRSYGEAFGGTIAAPTFREFMSSAMAGKERLDFAKPPSDVERGKQVPVPNVVGRDLASATKALENDGFSVQAEEEFSDTVAAGRVISQSPRSSAYPSSTITLTVSKGPDPAAAAPPDG
jgi:membrane peptidoglycan carboxypeptidase